MHEAANQKKAYTYENAAEKNAFIPSNYNNKINTNNFILFFALLILFIML